MGYGKVSPDKWVEKKKEPEKPKAPKTPAKKKPQRVYGECGRRIFPKE